MRIYIYTMIINNEYDYDNEGTTTDNLEIAYDWLRAGCKEIAMLDACSYEYLGYMDYEDLPEFKQCIEG